MMTLTSTQIGQLVAQFFLAGAGTLSFAVLFACPKRTLPCCALVGAVGWFVYELAVLYGADAAAASLIAVIPLSLAARICAVLLKTPVTVFLLTGIFPLVPGAGIYYTAYYFIQGENALSLANGISTFKVAVALAVGIALHEGQTGWWNVILNWGFCAAVWLVSLSGVVMWWKRRPSGALRLAAPPAPAELPLARGVILIALALSLAFPVLGLTLLAILALDLLILSPLPALKRALS